MLSEKETVLRAKRKLEEELSYVAKEHEMLKESAAKEEAKSRAVLNESKRTSKAYDFLTRDVKEKEEIIDVNRKAAETISIIFPRGSEVGGRGAAVVL